MENVIILLRKFPVKKSLLVITASSLMLHRSMWRKSMADWSANALRSILLMATPRSVMLFIRNPENPLFWILSTVLFSTRMLLQHSEKNINILYCYVEKK